MILKLKEIHDFLIFLVMIQLSLIIPQVKTNILLDSKNDTKEHIPPKNKLKDFETKLMVTKEKHWWKG